MKSAFLRELVSTVVPVRYAVGSLSVRGEAVV